MELFQELLLTLLAAVFISFLIAKLVSKATGGVSAGAGDVSTVASSPRSGDRDGVGELSAEVIVEELSNAGRLRVTVRESEGRAAFVGEAAVDRVEEFVGEPAEEEASANERREVTEKATEEVVQTPGVFVPDEIRVGATKLGDEHVEATSEKTGEKEIVSDEAKEGNNEEEKREGSEAVVIGLPPRAEQPEEIGMEEEEPSDEGVEEKKVDIEIEDDWEGIERSDLEVEFAEAARFAESGYGEEKLASIGSDVQMELYGLHKLVTEGPCHEQPPMALKLSARAKWNAWQKLGNMDPEVAMKQYVDLLSDSVPHWTEEQTLDDSKVRSASERADPVDAASDISTPSSNLPYERGPEPKHDSGRSDSTGGLHMEDTVKE